ncbi:SNARE associated Golgi protein [Operophtera brumata]|uniref:SNARE associated Golgi protein n=1 Tax=Operophtera brumata TaxID=104452 RepID=A0A0L7LFE2_OPEBR|nr:SNARE associated Golgi protein [Operophtera brumata]
MLGLFPAQLIHVYVGSTLRSMHEVLHESHVTGYIVFALQAIYIALSVLVTFDVVQLGSRGKLPPGILLDRGYRFDLKG